LPRCCRDALGVEDLDAGLLGDVLEVIAGVAIEDAGSPLERLGWAEGAANADQLEILLEVEGRRPGDVIADEQVELAVAVVIEERRRAGERERLAMLEEVARRLAPAAGAADLHRIGHVLEDALFI